MRRVWRRAANEVACPMTAPPTFEGAVAAVPGGLRLAGRQGLSPPGTGSCPAPPGTGSCPAPPRTVSCPAPHDGRLPYPPSCAPATRHRHARRARDRALRRLSTVGRQRRIANPPCAKRRSCVSISTPAKTSARCRQVRRSPLRYHIADMEQQIGFCTTDDGVRIAFGTYGGDGPPLFVLPDIVGQEAIWKHAGGRALLEELGTGLASTSPCANARPCWRRSPRSA